MQYLEHRIRQLERKLLRIPKQQIIKVVNPPIPIDLYCNIPTSNGIIGRVFIPFNCILQRLYIHIGDMGKAKILNFYARIVNGDKEIRENIVVTKSHTYVGTPFKIERGSRITFAIDSDEPMDVRDIWISGMLYVDLGECEKRLLEVEDEAI